MASNHSFYRLFPQEHIVIFHGQLCDEKRSPIRRLVALMKGDPILYTILYKLPQYLNCSATLFQPGIAIHLGSSWKVPSDQRSVY